MTLLHPAAVHWSDEKRKSLPTSGRYVTVARFAEDAHIRCADAWSVVLQIQGDVDSRPCKADVRFLSPDAPQERLSSGVRFELMEGSRVTAIVEVL
jgi:hypothetical protein